MPRSFSFRKGKSRSETGKKCNGYHTAARFQELKAQRPHEKGSMKRSLMKKPPNRPGGAGRSALSEKRGMDFCNPHAPAENGHPAPTIRWTAYHRTGMGGGRISPVKPAAFHRNGLYMQPFPAIPAARIDRQAVPDGRERLAGNVRFLTIPFRRSVSKSGRHATCSDCRPGIPMRPDCCARVAR